MQRPTYLRRGSLPIILVIAVAGCRPVAPIPITSLAKTAVEPWFADVTQEVGIEFLHSVGPTPLDQYFMPQMVGSGAALFDFDNDGRLDIYLVQNGGPESGDSNRLFHQTEDGRFRDVSAGSGLDVVGFGMGVAVGDVNTDGWADVLVTEYGGLRLFQNRGNGSFREITKAAKLDNPHWGTSAAFLDYDRDGWLDLVVANYVDYDPTKTCTHRAGMRDYCGPNVFVGTVTRLFRNLGRRGGTLDAIEFEDVTVSSGLARYPGPGLGVVVADFDGDRWPDIFVADDGQPNRLWINQRDGTFAEEAVLRGVAYNGAGQTQANMGIAVGDVDGDGLFDLFVTHLTDETHILLKQSSRGFFRDATGAARLMGTDRKSTGFGAVMGDFDQDGAVDLALVNGRVSRDESRPQREPSAGFWAPYLEPNQLLANDGAGRFRDISSQNAALCGTPGVGRGLAIGDINGDGSLDLVVTGVSSPVRVLYNKAPRRGHWLIVRAIDPSFGGRDAYGAEVTVTAGARRYFGLVNPGHSYLCSNDPRAHFGLGSAEMIDTIHVAWPDGTDESFPGGVVDRVVLLRKGEGQTLDRPAPTPAHGQKAQSHE